jgi:hypothetical protein
MIQDQAEYDLANAESLAQAERLEMYKANYRSEGHTDDEVRRLMEPLVSFHLGRREEIEAFERSLSE